MEKAVFYKRNGTEDDITRFFDSKGVDVFHGDEEGSYKVHLLNATDEIMLEVLNDLAGSNNYIARTTNDLFISYRYNKHLCI